MRTDTKMVEKIVKIFLDPEIIEASELEDSLSQNDMFQDLVKQAIEYEED